MKDWFKSLKVGDNVAIEKTDNMNKGFFQGIVQRFTKTMILIRVKQGKSMTPYRFYLESGDAVGGDPYHRPILHEMTLEIKEKITIRRLTNKANYLVGLIKLPKDIEGLKQFIENIKPYARKEE